MQEIENTAWVGRWLGRVLHDLFQFYSIVNWYKRILRSAVSISKVLRWKASLEMVPKLTHRNFLTGMNSQNLAG